MLLLALFLSFIRAADILKARIQQRKLDGLKHDLNALIFDIHEIQQVIEYVLHNVEQPKRLDYLVPLLAYQFQCTTAFLDIIPELRIFVQGLGSEELKAFEKTWGKARKWAICSGNHVDLDELPYDYSNFYMYVQWAIQASVPNYYNITRLLRSYTAKPDTDFTSFGFRLTYVLENALMEGCFENSRLVANLFPPLNAGFLKRLRDVKGQGFYSRVMEMLEVAERQYALLKDARLGNYYVVSQALQQGNEVFFIRADGSSIIHHFVMYLSQWGPRKVPERGMQLLKSMLSRNPAAIELFSMSYAGTTPIRVLVEKNCIDVMRLVCSHGLQVNYMKDKSISILHEAFNYQRYELIEFFLFEYQGFLDMQHHSMSFDHRLSALPSGYSLFHCAVNHGEPRYLLQLLMRGSPIYDVSGLTVSREIGQIITLWPHRHKFLLIRHLLDKGYVPSDVFANFIFPLFMQCVLKP